MDAIYWQKKEVVPKLLKKLVVHYPTIDFVSSDSFYWSPRKDVVHYVEELIDQEAGEWSLLHELSHALLKHQTYKTDFDLLIMELDAWEKAKSIAKDFSIVIDQDHIEDCLDTYRDWLYQRSTCPRCTNCSQQISSSTYRCFNCNNEWQVSASRKCRIYRKNKVLA